MLRPRIPRTVAVDVAEIPRLARMDRLAATGTANTAGQHDRDEPVPDLPMSAAIAPTDRLRRTHRVVSAGIVLGERKWRHITGS